VYATNSSFFCEFGPEVLNEVFIKLDSAVLFFDLSFKGLPEVFNGSRYLEFLFTGMGGLGQFTLETGYDIVFLFQLVQKRPVFV
jgi:hypothetical protein